MNREQRRLLASRQPRQSSQAPAAVKKFQMRYGHDGQRVHLVMPFHVQDLVFTPAEAAAHIAMMLGVLVELQKVQQEGQAPFTPAEAEALIAAIDNTARPT